MKHEENEFDHLDLKQVKKLAERGHTDHFMADFFGISYHKWMYWKKAYPAFFELLKNWKDEADKHVERSLYESAIGYEHEEEKIFCEAKTGFITTVRTRKRYPPDVKAATFWLKNRKPNDWKDKSEVMTNVGDLGSEILKARRRAGIEGKEEAEEAPKPSDNMEFLE